MDKNTITGFILIGLVIVGFTWWSQPSQEEIEAYRHQQDSIALVQQAEEQMRQEAARQQQLKEQALATDTNSAFYNSRNAAGQVLTLRNGLVAIDLNTRGGLPERVVLNNYKRYNSDSARVELFDKTDAHFSISIDGRNEDSTNRDMTFDIIAATDSTATLALTTVGNAGSLIFDYTLRPNAYMLDLNIKAQGMNSFFSTKSKTLSMQWDMHARQQEKGFDFENRYASVTYKEKNGGTDYLSETSAEDESIEETLDWVAFKNQFFSCVVIANNDWTGAHLKSTPTNDKKSGYLKTYEAEMDTEFDPTGAKPTSLQFFFGPNDFHLLQAHNDMVASDKSLELEELVYLGWPLFRWINRWLILNLFDWLLGWGLHMGMVLLLLTVIVKLLVYPTTKKSFLSSARMRVLKPKIDEINAKYPNKEDALKKQQEVMGLYSQYGVSPMGGCLPMLIQMPVFIALFNFVPNAIQLRGVSFLWADDLSAYDELLSWNADLWLIGDHLSIFCLLFCVTNVINTMISMKQQNVAAMSPEQEQSMKMMRWMMYVMPVMFLFVLNNYSSGLNYYYSLSGILNIAMMWYLRKSTDDNKLLADLERRYKEKKAKGQGQSGGMFGSMTNMANRLQELQRLQEEQRKARQQK